MKKINAGSITKTIAWIFIITLIIANFTNKNLFQAMLTIYGILTLVVIVVCGFILVKQSLKYQKEITEEDRNRITEYLNKNYTEKSRKLCAKDEENENLLYTSELINKIDSLVRNFTILTKKLNSTKEEVYQIASDIEDNVIEQNIIEVQEAPSDIRMVLDIVFKYYDDLGTYIKTK